MQAQIQPHPFFEGRTGEALEFYRKAFGAGGQVMLPLAETFFARAFGMVTDKLGVGWMVIAGQKGGRR